MSLVVVLLISMQMFHCLPVRQCQRIENNKIDVKNLTEVHGDKFYYFGYGSNMLTKRIHIQNPTAVKIGPGTLKVSKEIMKICLYQILSRKVTGKISNYFARRLLKPNISPKCKYKQLLLILQCIDKFC